MTGTLPKKILPLDSMFKNADLKAVYQRVIHSLTQHSEQYFGLTIAPSFYPQRVIHRPFSEVIQCKVHFGEITQGIYIKLFLLKGNSPEEDARIIQNMNREAEVTKKMSALLSENTKVFVPRVIAYFPEERVLVSEEKKGIQLLQEVAKHAKGHPTSKKSDQLEAYCHGIGAWLKDFQKIPPMDIGKDEDVGKLLEYVDVRLKILCQSSHMDEVMRLRVLDFLEKKLSLSTREIKDNCSVHGDFSLSNILVASDQMTVLDFAMYRKGPRQFDPAYFYQHLEDFLTNPLFFKKTIAVLQGAFLEGYQNHFDRRDPLFVAYHLRNAVNHLVDLSRTGQLSFIKKLYQKRQYKQYFLSLQKIIQAG